MVKAIGEANDKVPRNSMRNNVFVNRSCGIVSIGSCTSTKNFLDSLVPSISVKLRSSLGEGVFVKYFLLGNQDGKEEANTT